MSKYLDVSKLGFSLLFFGSDDSSFDEHSRCYMNEETTSSGRFDEVNRNKKQAQPDDLFRHQRMLKHEPPDECFGINRCYSKLQNGEFKTRIIYVQVLIPNC